VSDRETLVGIFRAALDRVHAGRAVERWLRGNVQAAGPWTVLGAGKASSAMAAAARAVLGTAIRGGVVVTKDGHGSPVEGIDVIEAAHPVPDARSVSAAERALSRSAALGPEERLLVLLSGGASALWSAPVEGLSLEEKQRMTDVMLRAGADIVALNAVRKHVSRIKGGGLLRESRAREVLTLAVSDVEGDPPETIGSGPSAPDPTRFADALRVLEDLSIRERVPVRVVDHLEAGAAGRYPETPGQDDPRFARARYEIVACLDDALTAAVEAGQSRGLRVQRLEQPLRGEARYCARELAGQLRRASEQGVQLLVVGGEPTVTVLGAGVGGRAQELALAFALELRDSPGVTALFAGTDGSDGPTDAAGAIVDAGTLARAAEAGLDARDVLRRNDSHTLLRATGDLLITGPTQTNVTDLGLIHLGG
jgi:glycerate 2-kinase